MAETETKIDIVDEDKEKFDVGMSDEALLAQIDIWEKEGIEVYNKIEAQIKKNLDYYRGVQTDSHRIYGKRSKTVENRLWMAVETTIPIATSRLPDVIVKPGQEDEQSQMDALALQDVLNFHMERVQIQELAERFLRDMLVKRYGVFKVCWNEITDDVDVYVVDPKRVKIPAYGKTVNDLAFTIEELELSYETLVLYFGEDKAKEVVASAPKDSDTKVRKKTYLVKEVWTNNFVAWKCGVYLLKKQKNPYYNFKGENFCEKPKKPYVIKSLFETEESIVGSTDYFEQLIPIQDNINTRKRQIEDVTNKVANPHLLIDSQVMSEEEAANITNEPGGIIYGKQAADGTKVRFENPGELPQYVFQDLEFSRREFDNIWGMHSTTRGEREGRETLGGRQLLKAADLGRIDLVARKLERALDEIAELWTQLIKMFYTEERAFTILGDDGVRFVKNFSGQKVGKGVRPVVKQGSTLKEDENEIQQKAILLWQNKAIGIRTLYKMIRIPNMLEAIQDYQATNGKAPVAPSIPPPIPSTQ